MLSEQPATGKSTVERILGLVTEVRPGEAGTALLMTLNVFILLTAYYVIKPVREGLILELKSGAEYKSWMGGAIAVALLFAVPAYVRFARRVPRNRLVVSVTLFFAAHLVVFYGLGRIDAVRGYLGLVFYLWVGIFNMMVVAQFWAFANDIYTEEQGKRLFPLVGVGASVGAPLGSWVTGVLAVPVGKYQLLLVSAAILSVCALLFHVVHVRESRKRSDGGDDGASDTTAEEPDRTASKSRGAFGLVLEHRYLTLIALFSLLFTFVNTNGEYILSKLFKQEALAAVAAGTAKDVGDFLTQAYGNFFFYVNVLGAVLQIVVVSRIVKYLGLRIAFFVFPLVALLGAVGTAAIPLLAIVRVTKTMENSTDYSLNNTLRNMLWLPTTLEMKYRAKQAVDTFCVRMGDVGSAILVAVGASVLGWGVRPFAIVNVLLVAVWLVVAAGIVRGYGAMSRRDAS